MGIGLKLGRLRLEKKQSLQQVADAVAVSKAHIWELEKGYADNPSMGLVMRLADHFGVSVGFLIDEDLVSPDADDVLVRMFRQAKELNLEDRFIIDDMMQSMLKRRRYRDEAWA